MMSDLIAVAGMFFALTGVIAAAWAVSRFLGKRFGVPSSGKHIQVLEQLPLGNERGLYLIRCSKQVYLLGSSQAGIQLIDRIDEEEFSDE